MGTASEIQLRFRCIQNFQGKIGEKKSFLQLWGHSFCYKLDDENWLIIETPMDDFFRIRQKNVCLSIVFVDPRLKKGLVIDMLSIYFHHACGLRRTRSQVSQSSSRPSVDFPAFNTTPVLDSRGVS